MLELTTRFTGISTSPQARNGGLSSSAAAGKAKANLRYICRPSALGDDPQILTRGDFRTPAGEKVKTHHQLKAAMRAAIDERSGKGGARGIRVAEKMIFSLPNDWPQDAQREALQKIMRKMADGSRDAKFIGTIHRDKKHNLHGHILALDGLETEDQARARRPDAKRVRRREVLRLGDRGRPKEMRRLFADVINEVAAECGLSGVEHRSFKERGLTHPTKHEGPTRRAQRRTEGLGQGPDPVAAQNAARRKKRAEDAKNAERVPVAPHKPSGGVRDPALAEMFRQKDQAPRKRRKKRDRGFEH